MLVVNIAFLRRLCSAISEHITYRWFLTIDNSVLDLFSISHFNDRIVRGGFAAIYDGRNDDLPRPGMLGTGDVRGFQSRHSQCV